MSKEHAFRLPYDNKELSVALVQGIPETWSSCSGQLVLPMSAEEEGLASGAGFLLDGMVQFGKLEVATPLDYESRQNPTDTELVMSRRERIVKLLSGSYLPSFVEFQDAGKSASSPGLLPTNSVLAIVSNYLQRGYGGDLTFRATSYYEDRGDRSKVEMHTMSWFESIPRAGTPRIEVVREGHVRHETPLLEHGPLLKVFDERESGELNFMLNLCRDAELEEVNPENYLDGYSTARINL